MPTTAMPNISSSLDSFLSGAVAKADQNEREYKQKAEPIVERITSSEPPKIPTLKEAPKESDFNRSPLEAFGSGAGWLAVFGSMLTRRPLVSALNASASVMNAYKAQDAASFKKAFDTWKQETENAEKLFTYENEIYKDALERDKSALGAYAAMTKNDTLRMAIDAKIEQSHIKQRESYSRAFEEMKDARDYYDRLVEADKIAAEKSGQPWTEEMNNASRLKHYPEAFLTAKSNRKTSLSSGGSGGSKGAEDLKELDNLIEETQTIRNMIEADPSLVGARGSAKRMIQKAGSQVMDKDYYPAATALESKIEKLKARIAKPLLRTRYFTGKSQDKIDQLVKGLGRLDDPTTVKTSFDDLLSVMKDRREEVGGEPVSEPNNSNLPQVGLEEDGYIFMGGDPSQPSSWKKK